MKQLILLFLTLSITSFAGVQETYKQEQTKQNKMRTSLLNEHKDNNEELKAINNQLSELHIKIFAIIDSAHPEFASLAKSQKWTDFNKYTKELIKSNEEFAALWKQREDGYQQQLLILAKLSPTFKQQMAITREAKLATHKKIQI